MTTTPSPLDYVGAFGIVLAVGVAAGLGLAHLLRAASRQQSQQ